MGLFVPHVSLSLHNNCYWTILLPAICIDGRFALLQGLNESWERERDEMKQLQNIKAEMDRVNLEIQNAERDYDLNHAAELKYGTLMQLQKQLSEAETALEAQACVLRRVCMLTLLKSPTICLYCSEIAISSQLLCRINCKAGACV
jgi:hypothetical protein